MSYADASLQCRPSSFCSSGRNPVIDDGRVPAAQMQAGAMDTSPTGSQLDIPHIQTFIDFGVSSCVDNTFLTGKLRCDYGTIAQLCIYPSLRGHSFSLSCPLRSRRGQIESACRKLAQVARGNQVTQTFSPKWSFPQEGGRNR